MRAKFLSGLLLFFFGSPIHNLSASEFFRWVDEKGTIHFADNPKPLAERYRKEDPKRRVALPETALRGTVSEHAEVSNPPKFIIGLARHDGRLFVKGNINHHSPLRFIVDTGASMTVIPAKVAARLGIDSTRALLIELRGIGGAIDGKLIEVDSLKVGNAEARNFDVVVVADELEGTGLLGGDFLSRFQLDINYTRDQMVLQPGEGPYDGYPAAWWQEKFRLYGRLKRLYEQRIKQNFDHLKSLGINPDERNWEHSGKVNPLRPIADEIREHENYLKVLEKKTTDLQLRANRAELPMRLRQ